MRFTAAGLRQSTGTGEGVLRHLQKYAEPELAEQLAGYDGRISYDYDWSLNDAP